MSRVSFNLGVLICLGLGRKRFAYKVGVDASCKNEEKYEGV